MPSILKCYIFQTDAEFFLSCVDVEISLAVSVTSALSPAGRGIRQTLPALALFAFNAPRKARHTVGGDAAIPTSDDNHFVLTGVIITNPINLQ